MRGAPRQTGGHPQVTAHLRPPALAERLGTTTGTLANMRCAGRGPAYIKVGASVLYPLSAVEAYERAHMVETIDSARLRVSA